MGARYNSNKSVQQPVQSILREFGLEETSIDVEAFRLSMTDLMPMDRRISELAARRDKSMEKIEDYRAGLAMTCPKPVVGGVGRGDR